jgi:hypothetical protein
MLLSHLQQILPYFASTFTRKIRLQPGAEDDQRKKALDNDNYTYLTDLCKKITCFQITKIQSCSDSGGDKTWSIPQTRKMSNPKIFLQITTSRLEMLRRIRILLFYDRPYSLTRLSVGVGQDYNQVRFCHTLVSLWSVELPVISSLTFELENDSTLIPRYQTFQR